MVAFLSHPENYPGKPTAVERIDTHGAMIFLAGMRFEDQARHRLSYMDFYTLEKRRNVCLREVELNVRRLTAESVCPNRSGGICRAHPCGCFRDVIPSAKAFA